MKKSRTRFFPAIGLISVVLVMIPAPAALAIEIIISEPPTLTGKGRGLKARFHDVATVDGNSIDLFARILDQSTNKTNEFEAVGDDFKFEFHDGRRGENRWATVEWTFYESGSRRPVVVENLALTIDDLDAFSSRTESFETNDALSHALNDPTDVIVSNTGSTLTATGSSRMEPGNPESAVMMIMRPGSSFVITYRCKFNQAADAGFVHDGDGDFIFDNLAVRLFYTYHFDNGEEIPVSIDFSTDLAPGLAWDTGFTPQVTGNLKGASPQYDARKLSIPGLVLPPGKSSITLGTLETSQSGNIESSGSIVPIDPSGPPQGATAAMTLP